MHAIKEVREGHMSRHAASKAYGVPRSTLCDKLDGKSPEDRNMGPSTVLTKAEEATLAAFCIKFLKCGFPINRQDLCDIVAKVVKADKRRNQLRMAGQAFAGFRVLCNGTLNCRNVDRGGGQL